MKTTFDKPVTTVFDKGRRGKPLVGCDCFQCFGYCMLNRDIREREIRVSLEHSIKSAYRDELVRIELAGKQERKTT